MKKKIIIGVVIVVIVAIVVGLVVARNNNKTTKTFRVGNKCRPDFLKHYQTKEREPKCLT